MEIIIGKTAGFCGGMQNAVRKAEAILEKEKRKIYCIGDLAHNPQVMDSLNKKGLIVVSEIKEVPDGQSAILRAHGVAKEVYEEAKTRNIRLWDLTCPRVLKIHEKVENYQKEGNYIILISEKGHPETIGTYSFCRGNASLITEKEDIEEAMKQWKDSQIKRIVILSQTTFSMKKFDEIAETIKEKVGTEADIQIEKTICDATRNRQKETEEIAKQVEYMCIIGGKNSSNTHKLYEIAKRHCKEAIWIQTAKQIKELPKVEKVGIMAGASTPEKSIKEVIKKIERLGK